MKMASSELTALLAEMEQKVYLLEAENQSLKDQLGFREDKGPIIGISLIDHSFLYLSDVRPKPR
jgi:cell shape-determining protein MreC